MLTAYTITHFVHTLTSGYTVMIAELIDFQAIAWG